MVKEKREALEIDDDNEEVGNFLKFGRNARICFGRRDCWIEVYCEDEVENKKTKEKEIRKRWVQVTGYYGRVKQLLLSYTDEMFLKHGGNLDEYKKACEDIIDAVEMLPDYLISQYHQTPVIIQEKVVVVDSSKKKEEMLKKIEAQHLAKIEKVEKIEKTKKQKKQKAKKGEEETVELF